MFPWNNGFFSLLGEAPCDRIMFLTTTPHNDHPHSCKSCRRYLQAVSWRTISRTQEVISSVVSGHPTIPVNKNIEYHHSCCIAEPSTGYLAKEVDTVRSLEAIFPKLVGLTSEQLRSLIGLRNWNVNNFTDIGIWAVVTKLYRNRRCSIQII